MLNYGKPAGQRISRVNAGSRFGFNLVSRSVGNAQSANRESSWGGSGRSIAMYLTLLKAEVVGERMDNQR